MSANETFYETFSTDLPDIQGFIQKLDLMDENINKAVREGLHKGADIICREQKRLAPSKLNLSQYISKGNIYTTKKGVLGVAVGYMADTFKKDENGFNPGVVAMTYEFGRPGKTPERSDEEMKQIRKRIPNKDEKRKYWKKAVPTEVKIKKGAIQPHSHIRRGFHNAAPQACQAVIDAIQNQIDKMGDN